MAYTDPAGNVLQKPTAPAPSPSGSGASSSKPAVGAVAGAGGFAIDSGLSSAESGAQSQTDVLTRAGSVDAKVIRYDFFDWSGGTMPTGRGRTPLLGSERGTQVDTRMPLASQVSTTKKSYTSVTAFDLLKNMSPDQRAKVQHQLYDAGWYKQASARYYSAKDPKQPNYGAKKIDADTATAFNEAIGFAIQTRQSLDDVLGLDDGLRLLDDARKEDAATRQPLVVQLTPEETIRSVARKLWMQEAGRDPTPAEVNRLLASYHGIETSAQQQAYAAGGSGLPGGPGGTVVTPPSPQDYAEEQVGQVAPVEAGAQRMEQGLAALRKLFTGGSDGG